MCRESEHVTHPRSEMFPPAPAGDYPPPPPPLPAPAVDSHCHLDLSRHDGAAELDPTGALAAARAVGVSRVVQIGCDLGGARWAVAAADEHPGVLAGVALHPNEAPRLAERGELDAALAEVERLADSSERVRAVGETGLDHFRTGVEGRAAQEASFRAHIAMAKRLGKALVVHDRDAHEDVLRVLDQEGAPQHVVLHCFSGDSGFTRRCVERGYVLSFAGTVTFRNAGTLREALALVPPEQLMVETDSPYLTPTPHRGRPNGPYLLPLTVRAVADVLGADAASVCAITSSTAERVFGTWW